MSAVVRNLADVGSDSGFADTRTPSLRGGGGYLAVRTTLAAVLITAAILKGYQLATGPVPGTGLFSSRIFLIAVVEFEWLFGVWLLLGLYPKWTWRVVLGCFGLFACVSLYKGLSGEVSCGCFGQVEVSPWWTLALDVAAVLGLVLWPPHDRELSDEPVCADPKGLFGFYRVGVALAVAILVGMPGALLMATYRPTTLGKDGVISGPGNLVVLQPQKWVVGKRFPLLKHIDIGERLAHGEWLVVLWRHDCPKCEELLSRCARLGDHSTVDVAGRRLALVEVPPYGKQPRSCIAPSCVRCRLTDKSDWLVSTPVEVLLSSGRVVRVLKNIAAAGTTEVLVSEHQRAGASPTRHPVVQMELLRDPEVPTFNQGHG